MRPDSSDNKRKLFFLSRRDREEEVKLEKHFGYHHGFQTRRVKRVSVYIYIYYLNDQLIRSRENK